MSLHGGIAVRPLTSLRIFSGSKTRALKASVDVFPSLEAAQRRSSVVPVLFVLAVVVVGGDPWGPATSWLEAVCVDRRGGTRSRLPVTTIASAAIAS